MAVTATPVMFQAINLGVVQCVNADGTAAKTVFTAGSNGSRVMALWASSDDSANRTFYLYLVRSATSYLLATVQVPLDSGHVTSANSVDFLRSGQLPALPLDAFGNPYLDLKSGDTLTVALTTSAVTAAKTVSFFCQGEDL